MTEKGKMAIKKWVLAPKCGYLGAKKLRVGGKIERLNGAKCRFCS